MFYYFCLMLLALSLMQKTKERVQSCALLTFSLIGFSFLFGWDFFTGRIYYPLAGLSGIALISLFCCITRPSKLHIRLVKATILSIALNFIGYIFSRVGVSYVYYDALYNSFYIYLFYAMTIDDDLIDVRSGMALDRDGGWGSVFSRNIISWGMLLKQDEVSA